MSPIVSVILPTCNDLHYIETTIRTVCAQSFTNFELIVVDDGSTDESPVRLHGLVATDTRLRYVRIAHAGAAAARNVGLEQARGRYIAFVDGHDLLHPAFLHHLVSEAESSQADVVICSPRRFNDGLPCVFPDITPSPVERMEGQQALCALLTGRIMPKIWNRLYRRSALGDLRLIPGIAHADLEYSARVLTRARTVSLLNLALYGYRRQTGTVHPDTWTRLVKDRIKLAGLIKSGLQEQGQWPAVKPAFQIMAARHIGYYGFKDLIRASVFNPELYQQLLDCLLSTGELTIGLLRQMPVSRSERKWVGLPMLNQAVGRWFLAYQFKRLHRRQGAQG
jgi:glycosyltransferase involved in cell wall biosynthesis